jgi:predicted esterase
MVMVHGRGAGAEDMIALARMLPAAGFAFLAPQAAGNTWYPHRFVAPIESNEPWLSSALATIEDLLRHLERAGLDAGRTMVLGFSQGACLALEYVARNARRYGGVAGLSGGLIGPDGTSRDYPGSLAGTPVFIGCSDVDPHIPVDRVHHSADVFRRLGASVSEKIYPRMGHTINEDELEQVQAMMRTLLEPSARARPG